MAAMCAYQYADVRSHLYGFSTIVRRIRALTWIMRHINTTSHITPPTLVSHVVILTIHDLNVDSEMLCVKTAMEVDTLLEFVRKVE